MTGSFKDDIQMVARGWRWSRRSLPPASAGGDQPAETRSFPTEWARRPGAITARAAILQLGFKPLIHSQISVAVEGLDRLEGVEQPVVFVSNHSSHLDTPLILCSLPPSWRVNTAVVAAADYFFDSWWRGAATSLAFNAVPIERRARSKNSVPIELIDEGWNLLVYPEGTRSSDGWVHPFRAGAALLCSRTGRPAVPIAIRGAYRAMPRGRSWPVPGRPRVSVRYGAPVWPEGRANIRAFSDELFDAVARLWREGETTWWESLRHNGDASHADVAGPDASRWRRVWAATAPPEKTEREAW
jgi:1-acyl-sn-glycerol-3-phosphate acyltransferase